MNVQLPSQRKIPLGTRELKRAADFLNLTEGKGGTGKGGRSSDI